MGNKIQNPASMQCIHEGKDSHLFYLDKTSFGVPVIVKQTRRTSLVSQQDALLANEYSMTKDSSLPGIRRALDFGSLEGRPALYLEYVDGTSLYEMFVTRRQTCTEMLAVAVELAAILVALHQNDIIHRNINSSNILVKALDQKPVIIDFSIAARLDTGKQHLYSPEQLQGDVAYMAPEQSGRINRFVDRRTDLYSLGVVFYEMFTGTRPFRGESTAELLHDHIARNPTPVCEVDRDIPRAVSDIVMRLLRKNPEDRYQSAFGLFKDLKFCLDEYRRQGAIPTFTLGQNDFTGKLDIPAHLYDREQEVAVLREAFARVAEGACERALVSGHAGTGKTLLVTELGHHVTGMGGIFVSGRYDQYQRNIPYRALNQAFAPLVRRILSFPAAEMSAFRDNLLKEAGVNGWLLAKALPELEPLLGVKSSLSQSSSANMHQELYSGICKVLSAFASRKTPLVVFLDDLQWADEASLKLIDPLFRNGTIPFCLLIGAFRDDVLYSSEARNTFIKSWSQDAEIRKIYVRSLDVHGVTSLIAGATGCYAATAQPLAELVHEKTGGNPLLVREFMESLCEERLLTFDFSREQWRWDITKLHEKAAIDDVAASVTAKIENLTAQARELLQTAACIGDTFDMETVSSVVKQPFETITDILQELADKQLLQIEQVSSPAAAPEDEPLAGKSRMSFTHNRVRQAAYSHLATRDKRETHLQLGRFFLGRNNGKDFSSEQLLRIVNHLNDGFKYITARDERLRLAELNLLAGSRMKEAMAHQAAVWYLNMGMGLLPAAKWQDCYELTSRMFAETIEAEYLSRNFPRVFLLTRELIENAKNTNDKIPGLKFQLLAHAAQNENAKTLETALAALETLGVLSAGEIPDRTVTAIASSADLIDTETIVRASHTLSKEIHLDQLLDKLMQLVIKNAGAEKGLLIVLQGEELMIRAKVAITDERVEIMQEIPLHLGQQVPRSVINYVVRTGDTVVLDDALHEGGFTQDLYIGENRVRSLLCMPIVHQAKMAGLLYLENRLATNVFTKNRMELLQSLLSQAAISMENARLYAHLEEKIHELNQTQLALESSRNWLDKIINTMSDPVFVKDRQHRWVLLNDTFSKFMGYPQELMLGKSDYDFYPQAEADIFWAKDELVFSTGRENINEETFTDAHGKVHTIITKKALYQDDHNEQYIVGIITDITERVDLESQLRQAVKMEAVGTLAGGVAHDFNNILTAILGYCDLLLMRIPDNNHASREIKKIKKAGESAASLTRQLLAFSRKQVIEPRNLDLNQIVKDTKNMLRRLIGEDILLQSSLAPHLHQAIADPVLIEQVIMNLSVNARDAMPTGGQLTIETANAYLDESYCQHYQEVTPGAYVMLAISDTGTGLDQETITHIFEPFYTTKEKGKGTGLGLATVYGIVKQSLGHIAVYSEVGHGTSFKIYLPRADGATATPDMEKEQQQEHVRGGVETILITEDNDDVRELACAILEEKGYMVISASCGRDALQVLNELADPPDLLITDMVMPEISGRQLINEALALHPGLKTMYISGYTGNAMVRHGVLEPDTHFLQKPFTPDDLTRKVREILDSSDS